MPLHVQFLRDGEPRKMPNGFGGWHLGVALDAGAIEYARRLHLRLPDFELAEADHRNDETHRIARMGWRAFDSGSVTVTQPISFRDPKDGEVLELEPGDEIRMWR